MSERKMISPSPLGRLKVYATYNENVGDSTLNNTDNHIHNECEIYINLSGDVSFVVENKIYPISPGSIIITRPGEYHHCVYHSNALHKHFWILFSTDRPEEIFDRFYKRAPGENNMLLLSGSNYKRLTDVCHALVDAPVTEAEYYYLFFSLIHLIDMADISLPKADCEAPLMDLALDYIHKNLSEPITVKDIASAAFVSVNTLERHFIKNLQISPSMYLKKRRLSHAAELLQNGARVTDACEQSGFTDCSKFIILFRKHYGTTPFKYKKQFK